MATQTTLIVGGTAGLGLELAKQLSLTDKVIVTGRHDPQTRSLEYREFHLSGNHDLAKSIEDFVGKLPMTHRFIYAAGYYQEGTLTELSEADITHMLNVGINAPIWFMRELLQNSGKLDEFVAITSTSQWIPRRLEPIYTTVKAGLGHFANSMAEDGRVTKTLVVGPAGMRTDFWRMTQHDQTHYNDPAWVAEQILQELRGNFRYKFLKVLRDPPRTEVGEQR